MLYIQPNSDAREVYSAVNDGEGFTKVAVLLKSPDASLGEDKFKQYRPLLAVVRKGRYVVFGGVLLAILMSVEVINLLTILY